MTFHPKRYVVLGFAFLGLSLVAPPVADWFHTNFQPPPGYGAVEDCRRAGRLPAPVRATVKERSAGSEASWVKEVVEGGAWVYQLHVLKSQKWSVIRITPNGNVIRLEPQEPEPGGVGEAGG